MTTNSLKGNNNIDMSRQEEDFRKQAEMFADETRDTAEDKYQTRHDYLAGCEHGYQYTKKMIEDYLLCVELSNFFPTLSDEDADKGKDALTKSIKEFLEEM